MRSDVLQRVLLAGVVDADPWIREHIFTSLGEPFDAELAAPEALRAVLMALEDEAFEIRLASAKIVGRLAHASTALVLP